MDVSQIIASCGFEAQGVCPSSALVAKEEVRAMCAADKCHAYDHSWSCPPACGSIDHFQQLFSSRKDCYVAQSFGTLEDEFDFEGMMEIEATHKERMRNLQRKVLQEFPQALVFSAGTCQLCSSCSYPEEPCRLPGRMTVSMEAAGLVVSEVCTAAQVPYYHGKGTASFTSCVLL